MPINIGSTPIQNIKIGTAQVQKVMLGANQVWPAIATGAFQPMSNGWVESKDANDTSMPARIGFFNDGTCVPYAEGSAKVITGITNWWSNTTTPATLWAKIQVLAHVGGTLSFYKNSILEACPTNTWFEFRAGDGFQCLLEGSGSNAYSHYANLVVELSQTNGGAAGEYSSSIRLGVVKT